ncbi:hypothetical protein [Legionella sp. CNM-4043-24]|uniref:hypothetical protein n=1 Tax=Legionella sp. CNM-4043-24 TaxID=3421646 RepID=UPI00403ABBF5
MEPVSIAIICVAVFGAVATLAAFVRQLLLSRDKKLNDLAQQRALAQEASVLERMRSQMTSGKRFDAHYQVLGSNKVAIQYLDRKIDDLFTRKSDLIQKYAQVALRESSAIITGEQTDERRQVFDRLKSEIDNELRAYDKELENLQIRRGNLWDSHKELEDYLLEQEEKRNKQLDGLYEKHSVMLEKLYVRHADNNEKIARMTMEAGTSTYKESMRAPVKLISAFRSSQYGSTDALHAELARRKRVLAAERELNEDSVSDAHVSRYHSSESNLLN